MDKDEKLAQASAPTGLRVVETDLDTLSNRANDLIHAGQWDEAEAVCQRLKEEFPEELDAEHRLGELYEAKGDYALALQWTRAALAKAQENSDKFDPELVATFEEQAALLKTKLTP